MRRNGQNPSQEQAAVEAYLKKVAKELRALQSNISASNMVPPISYGSDEQCYEAEYTLSGLEDAVLFAIDTLRAIGACGNVLTSVDTASLERVSRVRKKMFDRFYVARNE